MIVPVFLLAFLINSTTPQPPEVSQKTGRTAAQQKIDSQLLFAIDQVRGEADGRHVPPPAGVRVDARGRALVDIRAEPTAALQKKIARIGGEVIATSSRDRSIVARVPLLELETCASDPAVAFIAPAAEAATHHPPGRR